MKRKLDEAEAREKAYIESQKKLYELLASTTINTNTNTTSTTVLGIATILKSTTRTPSMPTATPITCWNCWGKGHHAGKCPDLMMKERTCESRRTLEHLYHTSEDVRNKNKLKWLNRQQNCYKIIMMMMSSQGFWE